MKTTKNIDPDNTEPEPSRSEVVRCDELLVLVERESKLAEEKKALSKAESEANNQYWSKVDEWREANYKLFEVKHPDLYARAVKLNETKKILEKESDDLNEEANKREYPLPKYLLD